MNPQDPQNPNPATANTPEVPAGPPQPPATPMIDGNEVPKTVIAPTEPPKPETPAELPVAAHMAGPPPTQPAPLPPSNPNAAFASQPPTNPAPVSPVQAGAPGMQPPQAGTPVLTQNDIMTAAKAQRSFKKPLFIGLGVLGAAILTVVVLTLTNVISLPFFGGNLKTVTYDNGSGNTYKLKFYASNSTDKVSNSLNSFANEDQNQLTAKEGKYPIALTIVAEEVSGDDKTQFDDFKNCDESGFEKAFETDNAKLGKLNVCRATIFGEELKDIMYMAAFEHNGKGHVVVVVPNIDVDSISSESEAKKLAEEASLVSHQDDIKKIIASIDPQ